MGERKRGVQPFHSIKHVFIVRGGAEKHVVWEGEFCVPSSILSVSVRFPPRALTVLVCVPMSFLAFPFLYMCPCLGFFLFVFEGIDVNALASTVRVLEYELSAFGTEEVPIFAR